MHIIFGMETISKSITAKQSSESLRENQYNQETELRRLNDLHISFPPPSNELLRSPPSVSRAHLIDVITEQRLQAQELI